MDSTPCPPPTRLLLASWVKAGFIVVAPLFPDENANKINSLGPRTVAQSELAESDVVNEPYDIAWVAGQVESGAAGDASSGAGWLKGLAEPGKIALAGHSDGAQAVAALVYSAKYASTYRRDGRPARSQSSSFRDRSSSGTYAPAGEPAAGALRAERRRQLQPAPGGRDAVPRCRRRLLPEAHRRHIISRPMWASAPTAPVVERLTAAFLKQALVGAPSLSGLSPSVARAGRRDPLRPVAAACPDAARRAHPGGTHRGPFGPLDALNASRVPPPHLELPRRTEPTRPLRFGTTPRPGPSPGGPRRARPNSPGPRAARGRRP